MLDSTTLKGPFQLEIFYDSMISGHSAEIWKIMLIRSKWQGRITYYFGDQVTIWGRVTETNFGLPRLLFSAKMIKGC